MYSAKYKVGPDHWKNYMCKQHGGVPEREPFSLYRTEWFYKTMVTAMDRSIGMVLDAVKELGLEENTLIVFTSDNGAEMGAGTAGIYREGKRSLMVCRIISFVCVVW